MKYLLDGNKPFITTDVVPACYRNHQAPGIPAGFAGTEQADLMLQEISARGFSIRLINLFVKADCRIRMVIEQPTVLMHFMLEGPCIIPRPGTLDDILIPGNSHVVSFPVRRTHTLRFTRGTYKAVHLALQPCLLEPSQFPVLHSILGRQAEVQQNIRPAQIPIDFRINALLDELLNGVTSTGVQLFMQARIYELLWIYIQSVTKAENNSSSLTHSRLMQSVRSFIGTHLEDKLSTSLLAKQFGISSTTLKRQFRLQFNQTIRDYIFEQRMLLAKQLITHTELPVSTIGTRIGYVEFSSFTRAFIKRFGHPPSQFRKSGGPSGQKENV